MNLLIYVSRDDAAVDLLSQTDTTAVGDLEKGHEGRRLGVPVANLRKGRPDIAALITDSLSVCATTDQVGVGACGPVEILDTTRHTLFHRTFDEGPFITLHTEVRTRWVY